MKNKSVLVRISGPSLQLDDVISSCCQPFGFIPLEPEGYISKGMGYAVRVQDDVYAGLIEQIDSLAAMGSFEIDPGDAEITPADVSPEYVDSLYKKLKGLENQRTELLNQLDRCREAINKYRHLAPLEMEIDVVSSLEYICVRFGYLSNGSLKKLEALFSDEPYLFFWQQSGDENGVWGTCFAPKKLESRMDSVLTALNFVRLNVSHAAGTAQQIVDNLENNIKIVSDQLSQLDNSINGIGNAEKQKLCAIYTMAKKMQKVTEFKKNVAYKSSSCFFVGTISARKEKAFLDKLGNYKKFEAQVDKMPKKAV